MAPREEELPAKRKPKRKVNPKITPRIADAVIESIMNGATIGEICRRYKFTRSTEYAYRLAHPDYMKRLEEALDRRTEVIEDVVYKEAENGNILAAKFWLTNRSHRRWHNEQTTRIANEEGGEPLRIDVREIVVELPKPVEDEDGADSANTDA